MPLADTVLSCPLSGVRCSSFRPRLMTFNIGSSVFQNSSPSHLNSRQRGLNVGFVCCVFTDHFAHINITSHSETTVTSKAVVAQKAENIHVLLYNQRLEMISLTSSVVNKPIGEIVSYCIHWNYFSSVYSKVAQPMS